MDKNKEFLIKLGENLRKIRNERKLSQQELADNCNVDKSTIYRIEKGQINPTITTVINICDVLKIDIFELTKVEQ